MIPALLIGPAVITGALALLLGTVELERFLDRSSPASHRVPTHNEKEPSWAWD